MREILTKGRAIYAAGILTGAAAVGLRDPETREKVINTTSSISKQAGSKIAEIAKPGLSRIRSSIPMFEGKQSPYPEENGFNGK